MKSLLDTNVFREIGKTQPHRHLSAWLGRVDDADLAMSTLTVREVSKGIVRLREIRPGRGGDPDAGFSRLCGVRPPRAAGHSGDRRTLGIVVGDARQVCRRYGIPHSTAA